MDEGREFLEYFEQTCTQTTVERHTQDVHHGPKLYMSPRRRSQSIHGAGRMGLVLSGRRFAGYPRPAEHDRLSLKPEGDEALAISELQHIHYELYSQSAHEYYWKMGRLNVQGIQRPRIPRPIFSFRNRPVGSSCSARNLACDKALPCHPSGEE